MLLSEYISGLQKILKEHGDLPCYYSSDDEGNSYQHVNYKGSVYYTTKIEYRLDEVYQSEEEFIEECDYEDSSEEEVELFPICIVN